MVRVTSPGLTVPTGRQLAPSQTEFNVEKAEITLKSMKFTRDLIIVNYFKWKKLDTLVMGKRHQETEKGKENTISLEICWERRRFPSRAV